MKKFLTITGLALIVLIVLLGFCAYYFQSKIKDQIIPQAKEYIRKNSKMDIDFEGARISFSKLLQLQPAIKVFKIRLGDGVYIGETVFEIYLKSLFQKEIKIKNINIDHMLLKLEENARKEVSLKGVKFPDEDKEKSNGKTKSEISFELINKLSIDEIEVEDSSLEFYAYNSHKPILLTEINAKLYDLNIGGDNLKSGKYNFSASLFNSGRSHLKANGDLGPLDFKLTKIPITGKEELSLFIEDIPLETRKKTLPDLIMISNKSQIKQKANFRGDLNSSIYGEGSIDVSNLNAGKKQNHYIYINSTIPHSYTYNLKKAIINLNSTNSKVKVTSQDGQTGTLIFNLNLVSNLQNQYTDAKITGSLDGLEIKEMLNCFTRYQDLISGKFKIESFSFQAQGIGANLSNNISGNAKFLIEDGSLYILNSLTRYQDMIGQILTNSDDFTQKLSGKFIKLTTDLALADQNIYLSNIFIDTPKVKINSQGIIDKAQQLNFTAILNVEKLKTPIPLNITGTIEKPRISPDLKQLGKTQTTNLVDTLLQLGLDSLNKKKATTTGATQTSSPATTELNSSNSASTTIANGNTAAPTKQKGLKKQQEELRKQKQREQLNSLLNIGLETLRQASQQTTTSPTTTETSTPTPAESSTQSSPQLPSTP